MKNRREACSDELQVYKLSSNARAEGILDVDLMTVHDSNEEDSSTNPDETSSEKIHEILTNYGDERIRCEAHVASTRNASAAPSDKMAITITREIRVS